MDFVNERMRAAAVELRILDRDIDADKASIERLQANIASMEEKHRFFVQHYKMLAGKAPAGAGAAAIASAAGVDPAAASPAPVTTPELAQAPAGRASPAHTLSFTSHPMENDAAVDSVQRRPTAASKKQRVGTEDASEKKCQKCMSTTTAGGTWHNGPSGKYTLCNRCGQEWSRTGKPADYITREEDDDGAATGGPSHNAKKRPAEDEDDDANKRANSDEEHTP